MTRWLAVLTLVLASSTSAQDYYEQSDQGWFWYDELPEESRIDAPIEPVAPAAPRPTPEANEPVPFSAAWMRSKKDYYLDLALDDPTEENVRAYMYFQRLMFDKSQRFAHTAQQVVLSDPVLDENNRMPLGSAARTVWLRERDDARGEALRLIAQQAGLYYFFDADCTYCQMQTGPLQAVVERFGFELLPVSMDGQGMPGLDWAFFEDQGQAKRFKIQTVPALVLAHPPNNFAVISQGMLAETQIESRLLMAADRLDLIPESVMERADPFNANLLPSTLSADGQQIDLDDPEDLVKYLRASLGVDEDDQARMPQ